MAIQPGTHLGPYEILSAIGAGGMGEVYRARDTKLGRDVAIKVLPEAFARDTERMARFQREAKVLASLDHPNIATIYGLEDSDGTRALVMQLVKGPTLADRIKAGPIPVDEALPIARQICDALEYAHERGIIHRDLKPANVKVSADDAVKILDFGLAKAMEEDAASLASLDISTAPALNRLATTQGILLGTAAYMSPEQAKGKRIDRRADIWAFGCVLYEMLTGKQAFAGETVTDTLASVIKDEPDLTNLPAATPMRVRVLLHRCLQKDAKQRLRDIGDARISLDEVLSGAPEGTPGLAVPVPAWRRVLPLAAGLLVAAITGIAVWNLKPSAPPAGSQAITRFAVSLPLGQELVAAGIPALALSPNGMQLVYAAQRGGVMQLYVRSMGSMEGRPIGGTEGAVAPFFSPDGQWVGFFAEGKLKKIPIAGGSALVICDSGGYWGGSWGPGDTIYFAPGSFSELWKVSADGGTPQPFTKLDRQKGEISHRWPQVLPGGKAVLFTVWTGPGWDEMQIQLQMVGSGERRVLAQGGHSGFYVPAGHLVYSREGTLMAVPFDLAQLKVANSAPFPIGAYVLEGADGAQYTLSNNGSLAYVPGTPEQTERSLVWVDRKGKVEALGAPPRPYMSVRISPDGRQVALTDEGPKAAIWIYNFERGTSTRLATEGSSQIPIWTPDGRRLAYRETRTGTRNVFWTMADGSGAEERLTTGEGNQSPTSWSPDGQALAIVDNSTTGATHLMLLRLSDHKLQPLLHTPFNEGGGQFSPDGRWLAYASDESGRFEVYVQAYPGPGGKWQISTDGGTGPIWNRSGLELFYRSANKLMAVNVTTHPSFSSGKPKMLFEGSFLSEGPVFPSYDVSPGGQRFLMIQPVDQGQTASTQINVVLNWTEELKHLVPTGK
jgi:serine/threonine-protein kinase